MPVNMQERLAAANAVHHAANEGPDGPIPGQYQLQLRRAKFAESESDGKFRIRWTFVVIGGEYDGEEVSDVSAVESPKKAPLRMAKERCRRLDVEPPVDVWGYAEVCPLLTQRAPIVTAQVTHSGNYANIRVLELLMAVGAPSAPSAAAAAPVPAAPAVSLPVAAPIPQAAAPAPVAAAPAVPAVPDEVGIGDTVRYIDPDSGQAYDGLADKINAGVVTVALDDDRQFDAPTESLTVLAKADHPVVGVPVIPMVPAPTAAPAADDVLRGDLLVIAKAFTLQANDLSSIEELEATLRESEWVEGGEDGLSAIEATTLRSVGIPVAVAAAMVSAPTPPPPPPPPAPAPAPAPKPKVAKKKAKKKAAKRKKRA